MLDFLDSIFEHPFWATLFSGFGLAILGALFNRIRKTRKNRKDKKSEPDSNSGQAGQLSQTDKMQEMQLLADIQSIQYSISCDLRRKQEEVYTRYFHKYKDRLLPEDRMELKRQASEIAPDYGILLSKLLGLLEAYHS